MNGTRRVITKLELGAMKDVTEQQQQQLRDLMVTSNSVWQTKVLLWNFKTLTIRIYK